MSDYKAPLRDVQFVLEHSSDLAALAALPGFGHADPATVQDLLAEAGRFMADTVGPLNAVGDRVGCVHHEDGTVTTPPGFKEAYAQYVEAGWGAVPFDEGYGGGGFPWIVGLALQELLTSSGMSFSMAPLLTQGAIDAIEHHGSEEQKLRFLPKMVTGEWTGSMNLTESQAGSDVGALRTKAERQVDGTYLISGTKIFITFGEHDMADNIVHLVLARTPDAPPGTKGISLFIVSKFLLNDDGTLGARNDVACVSIEHKLGIKASPTCVLAFGEHDGAVGYLVGEENRGMAYMFTMMNQARLSVGLQGLAIGERVCQQAVAYAQERLQGRAVGAPAGETSPIVEHADVRRMLLTMKATVEAMRRLCYWNAEALDISRHHPDADTRTRADELAALLTPLSKAWCTDMGVQVAAMNIQVHGGMGFIEETGAAQHLRDAVITPIYEGTNGIQAIDLVGRKLPMRGGGVVQDHFKRIAELYVELASAGEEFDGARRAIAESLRVTQQATQWLADHAGEPNDVMAGATPYLRLLATLTAGYLMARSALAARRLLDAGDVDADDAAFLHSKIVTARFFCEQLVPPANGLLGAITAGAGVLYELDPAGLAG
ncbi:MAG: acyl-CoA dehydrogenase [Acidimicrobiia bacterium]